MNGSGDEMDAQDVIQIPAGPSIGDGGRLTIRENVTDEPQIQREAVFRVEDLSVYYGTFRAVRRRVPAT